MKTNNIIYLRHSLEQTPTQRLEEMLREELGKEAVNDDAVRMILSVLEEREEGAHIEHTEKIDAAWNNYIEHSDIPASRPARKGSRILKAASLVAIVVVLFASFSQQVEAKGFFERLVRWTDSIFELFSPSDTTDVRAEYVFETDNPGLKQVYDAVVELGVTDPVVPMWLPEGYELSECKIIETPAKNGVFSIFASGNSDIVFTIDIYSTNATYEYYKDETQIERLEVAGTVHNIMRNNDEWIAVWTIENIECSIFIDCQGDTLYKILRSIYKMEDE